MSVVAHLGVGWWQCGEEEGEKQDSCRTNPSGKATGCARGKSNMYCEKNEFAEQVKDGIQENAQAHQVQQAPETPRKGLSKRQTSTSPAEQELHARKNQNKSLFKR